MNKNMIIPFVLFFLSALLTVVLHPFLLFFVGVAVCTIAALKYRSQKLIEPKLGATLLFRSGLAVIAGAMGAVVFVFAAMSGLLARLA